MAFTPFNRELCRQFLSGAIRHPEVLALCPYITDQDFDPDANRLVFSALRACLASGGEFSEHVLIDRLKSLGIKVGGAIEPGIYVNSLLSLAVNDKAAVAIAKEIGKVTIRRKLVESVQEMQRAIEQDATRQDPKKSVELVSEVTALFNKQVNLLSGSDTDEPRDLYATMDRFINDETTFQTGSIPSPFPLYNDLYGYFDPGNIYCWIARLKVGKSSFAMSMFQQIAFADTEGSVRALVLDTEMGTEEVQSRILASMTGIREFYIRHKLYKKHRHMRDKVDKAYEQMRPIWGKIQHVFIGGMGLEEQLSVARRWAFKTLRNGERGILALDYFKLASQSEFSSKMSRDLILGSKVDAYKNLVKKDLKIPMIAFGQANREGEDSKEGSRMSNSSVIAGSDMIAQFCSNIYLLEKLTPEQRASLNQLTPESATHSMKLIAPRQLGPNELGHDKLVRYADGKRERWCENHILLSFNNFVARECGTFEQIYERNKTMAQMQPPVDKAIDLL